MVSPRAEILTGEKHIIYGLDQDCFAG
jgi:hypothetical protein